MPEFGLNSSYFQHPDLVACRVCDFVFMSERALFDHMEVHLLLDESASRRRLLESHIANLNGGNQSPPAAAVAAAVAAPTLELRSPHAPSSSRRQAIRENNCILRIGGSNSTTAAVAAPLPLAQAPVSGVNNNNNNNKGKNKFVPILPKLPYRPQVVHVPEEEQYSRVDRFTRPFLRQLETTLLVERRASYVDREFTAAAAAAAASGGKPKVDVTLRLGRGN